jgi:hypothetical protein
MAKYETLLNEINANLDPDERILSSVMGTYAGKISDKNSGKNGILVATDKRLVFFSKNALGSGYAFENFHYSNIGSTEISKGMMGYSITFSISGDKITLKWIKDGNVNKLLQDMNNNIGNSSTSTTHTHIPNNQPVNDIAISPAEDSYEQTQQFQPQQQSFSSKIPGFRTGKKQNKIIASIGYVLIIFAIIGSLVGNDETETTSPATRQEKQEQIYDLKFDPQITTTCKDGSVIINANVNCPDGAIMQTSMLSADLKEVYNDKPVVKDKKISSTFKLTNTDVKNYAGMITFQFNADSIKQPDNVKEVYGQRGEKLEGNNAQEANFSDGGKGKIATASFELPYPSKEAVNNKIDELFNQMVSTIRDSSNGTILNIEHPSSGIIHMQVSNEWYLMKDTEKKYFAEEMLKTFTQVVKNLDNQDTIVFTIFDESLNTVASSKFLGGMDIEK